MVRPAHPAHITSTAGKPPPHANGHRPRLATSSREATRLASPCIGRSWILKEVLVARILVIDDQAGVRAFVCELLESLGHEADAAEDGPTGLALLPRQRYDLIITDLRMPHMSGWDVVEAVRQQVPRMPLIVISGFATDDDVERAAQAGVCLLQKPFQLAEVKRAIREMLSGKATRGRRSRDRASSATSRCRRQAAASSTRATTWCEGRSA